jgi:hypothetical protein
MQAHSAYIYSNFVLVNLGSFPGLTLTHLNKPLKERAYSLSVAMVKVALFNQ